MRVVSGGEPHAPARRTRPPAAGDAPDPSCTSNVMYYVAFRAAGVLRGLAIRPTRSVPPAACASAGFPRGYRASPASAPRSQVRRRAAAAVPTAPSSSGIERERAAVAGGRRRRRAARAHPGAREREGGLARRERPRRPPRWLGGSRGHSARRPRPLARLGGACCASFWASTQRTRRVERVCVGAERACPSAQSSTLSQSTRLFL